MTLVTRRYFKEGLSQNLLQRKVQLGALVLGTTLDRADIQIDDSTNGVEETLDDFMLKEGYLFEVSPPSSSPLIADVFPSFLPISDVVVVTLAAPTEIGGFVFNPSLFAPDLPNMFLYLACAIRTNGLTSDLQIVEDNFVLAAEDKFSVPLSLPNTGSAWQLFEAVTDVPLRSGLFQYSLQASTALLSLFEIRNVAVSLRQST